MSVSSDALSGGTRRTRLRRPAFTRSARSARPASVIDGPHGHGGTPGLQVLPATSPPGLAKSALQVGVNLAIALFLILGLLPALISSAH